MAVVDGPESRRVIGRSTEANLLERYGEELDKRRKGGGRSRLMA